MRAVPAVVVAALLLGACAAAPEQAAPTPQPRAEPPAATAPTPAAPEAAPEAPAAPAIPVAPDRWLHLYNFGDGVPGAAVDSAHALLRDRKPAREVVVAIIDGGVDVTHEDLDGVLWTNPGEVAGNGVDDDGNGYVDDVHGWNFIGGPAGESVDFDTYELTRLHAACLGRPAAGPLAKPPAEECAELAEAYEAERQEMAGMAMQIQQVSVMYGNAMQVLRRELNGEVTRARVEALRPLNQQVAQARQIFLQLDALGADEQLIADEAETIQGYLEYGLNLDFDPRPIVGDDYADPTERHYGNADVAGPDPSHGTAVASIVAAERHNGLGIDGVTNAARIMAVRAVPNGDERDKDVANAIRYAVDNGAHIINMSFGKAYSPFKAVVDEAVAYAEEHGVLLVHASGNDAKDLASEPNFPNDVLADGGAADLWLEVGASAWQGAGQLAAVFSNYGLRQVDLFAPGVALVTAKPGDGYGPSDGTSVAAPVVSGVAALLMAYFPDLSAAQVRAILMETATRLPDQLVVLPGDERTVRFAELSVSGGVVNAAAAVQRAAALAGR